MQIELHCGPCGRRFAASPETTAPDIIDRMAAEDAWYCLGDGETFEDMVFATLTEEGAIRCPDCGQAVTISEESLGRLAMEVLAQW